MRNLIIGLYDVHGLILKIPIRLYDSAYIVAKVSCRDDVTIEQKVKT